LSFYLISQACGSLNDVRRAHDLLDHSRYEIRALSNQLARRLWRIGSKLSFSDYALLRLPGVHDQVNADSTIRKHFCGRRDHVLLGTILRNYFHDFPS
jgi:hypothetical protein